MVIDQFLSRASFMSNCVEMQKSLRSIELYDEISELIMLFTKSVALGIVSLGKPI